MLPHFIRRARERFAATGRLVESEFNYDELRFSSDERWTGAITPLKRWCSARAIKLSENPFFKSIQLNPAKGEILTLRAPSFSDDRIIQRGKWIFRSTTDEIKAGTTYSWDRLDETTHAGRTR